MSIKILKQLALEENRRKHPNFPDSYRPIRAYSDKTANGLTECIEHFLNFSGHQAERISSSGRYIDNSQTYTDVVGFKRKIGSGKWIPGNTTKGTADISSTISVSFAGKKIPLSVKWEVKIGKDRQSKDQKRYEESIKRANGYYFIVKNFDDFYEKYTTLIKSYEQ